MMDTVSAELIALFQRAATMATNVVAAVRTNQLDLPSPCTEWTVGQLISHIVAGNLLFVSLAEETPPPPDDAAIGLDVDHVMLFKESIARLGSVFCKKGFTERVVRVPGGIGTGADLITMRVHEFVIHSWDLAKATDQPTDLDYDLVEWTMESMVNSTVLAEARGGAVGIPREAPAGSSSADRLAAFMGRIV